jgi:hypothetical protein
MARPASSATSASASPYRCTQSASADVDMASSWNRASVRAMFGGQQKQLRYSARRRASDAGGSGTGRIAVSPGIRSGNGRSRTWRSGFV